MHKSLRKPVSATSMYTLSGDRFEIHFTCEVRDTAGNADARTIAINGRCQWSLLNILGGGVKGLLDLLC